MATDRQRILNLTAHTSTTQIGLLSIPDTANYIHVEIARGVGGAPVLWPNPNTRAKYSQEVSWDGGGTWIGGGAGEWVGGARGGYQNTTMLVSVPPGAGRLYRGSFEVVGGPCLTEAFVEFRDG